MLAERYTITQPMKLEAPYKQLYKFPEKKLQIAEMDSTEILTHKIQTNPGWPFKKSLEAPRCIAMYLCIENIFELNSVKRLSVLAHQGIPLLARTNFTVQTRVVIRQLHDTTSYLLPSHESIKRLMSAIFGFLRTG